MGSTSELYPDGAPQFFNVPTITESRYRPISITVPGTRYDGWQIQSGYPVQIDDNFEKLTSVIARYSLGGDGLTGPPKLSELQKNTEIFDATGRFLYRETRATTFLSHAATASLASQRALQGMRHSGEGIYYIFAERRENETRWYMKTGVPFDQVTGQRKFKEGHVVSREEAERRLGIRS